MLIFSGIYENAKYNPNKICMIIGDRSITYGKLKDKIELTAKFLVSKYSKESIITIKNSNQIYTITNFLSCARAGLICFIENSKAFKKYMEPIKVIQEDFNLVDFKEHNNIELPNVKDRDIFLGIMSSGTTGHNKVIWRDHKSWMDALKYHGKVFNIDFNDILFLPGALCYSANLYSTIHILNEGGTVVFSNSIYPKTWIKEIKKNNVSTIFMVPAHYRMLLKQIKGKILSINSLLSCGEKLDTETISLLMDKFADAQVYEYYGASELGIVSYINFRKDYKPSSVGKAYPGVKLWINDELIWVKSPYIAPDFLSEATVYDIGKIDENGNLYVLGRKNNTINKGGVKILPYNIEKILDTHPKILKSVVFALSDKEKGNEIAAIIITKDCKLNIKEVRTYCKESLEPSYRPKKIKIIEDMKLNSSGKIDRKKLIDSLFKSYE